MAKSETDVPASPTQWIDLVATYSELGGASAYVQCKGPGQVLVVFSLSGTAPSDNSGLVLRALDSVSGTAAHIWVKALGQSALVACGLTD